MRPCSTLGVAVGTSPEVSGLDLSEMFLQPHAQLQLSRQLVSHASLAPGMCSTFPLVPHITLRLRLQVSEALLSSEMCLQLGARCSFLRQPYLVDLRDVSKALILSLTSFPRPCSVCAISCRFLQCALFSSMFWSSGPQALNSGISPCAPEVFASSYKGAWCC